MKKFPVILFGFLLFLLTFFVSGIVEAQDGLQYLAVARNIYYTGKPTAPVYEYGKENGWKNIHLNVHVGKDGNTYGLTGIGFSLAMLPAVAVTDVLYKLYNVVPPAHFPLENDWLIFLTTSFINIFFAALLGAIIYLYFGLIKVKHKSALFISLLTIFTTNLFAFSKHITAHMMFTSLLFTSFYLLKKYFSSSRNIYLYYSGLVYGIVAITYNSTFLLSVPPHIVYYILLKKPKLNIKSYKSIARDFIRFAVGILPFVFVYLWYENLRTPGNSAISPIVNYTKQQLFNIPLTVLFEGFWGQLFSPGRSIFIYSPLLLILVLFWFKIKKRLIPEVVAFGFLGVIYLSFYASFYLAGPPGQGFTAQWHGESSWGPRYLSPLIPFGMLMVGHIFQQLSKIQKFISFLPLSLIGLYVGILGVLLPYQIKYHYLEKKFYINETEYNVYSYTNLLPRYSPLIMQSNNLKRLITSYYKRIIPDQFNVKMYDGINFAFDVGDERWRSIDHEGYISFDNRDQKINNISFDIINHPISDTRNALDLTILINEEKTFTEPINLKVGERKRIDLDLSQIKLKELNNQLVVNVDYGDEKIIDNNIQIAAIINMFINETEVNKELITVPYVSDFGPKMTGRDYKNWGGRNNDPWRLWDLHTQTFERLPDVWWLRNLHYWDVPKKPLILLFIFNLLGVLYFGKKIFTNIENQKQ